MISSKNNLWTYLFLSNCSCSRALTAPTKEIVEGRQECQLCKGNSRRRRANTCTACKDGYVPKVDADECQNAQDTLSGYVI